MKFTRYILRIAATTALIISASGFAPAHAETGYRYWSFWVNDSTSWSMAQEGAGTLIPKDGDLQGWRYITAGAEVGPEFAPRSTETFDSICGDTAAEEGKVRVALVIDFGDSTDYSDGSVPAETTTSCAVLTNGDPSSFALNSSASVREEGGMVCSVNELPTVGCGESVEIEDTPVALANTAVTDTATPPADDDGSRLPEIVAFILGIIVFVMAWRRMQWQKQNKQQ